MSAPIAPTAGDGLRGWAGPGDAEAHEPRHGISGVSGGSVRAAHRGGAKGRRTIPRLTLAAPFFTGNAGA